MKRIKRIFFYVIIIAFFAFVTGAGAAYYYKDQIIQHIVEQINKKLATPINVARIDLDLLSQFPYLAVSFENVTIDEAVEGSTDYLAVADKLFCSFSPLDILRGNYSIQRIELKDATVFIRFDENGNHNFSIFKPKDAAAPVGFELENISLNNVEVFYSDKKHNNRVHAHLSNMIANLGYADSLYSIKVKGGLLMHNVGLGSQSFLKEKDLVANLSLQYLEQNKDLIIGNSEIEISGSDFQISGKVGLTSNDIQLAFEAKKSDVQTILSLVPSGYSKPFEKYQSKGNVYLSGNVEGKTTGNGPTMSLDFGFENASLFEPELDLSLANLSFSGSLSLKQLKLLHTGELKLESIAGQLGNNPFESNLEITNFNNPSINASFKGNLDVDKLVSFLPNSGIANAQGSIQASVSIEGKVEDFKTRVGANRITTSGQLDLRGISLDFGEEKLPLRNLSGALLFNKADLAIDNLSGYWGQSDFMLQGYFMNVVSYLAFSDQPVGIEADLKSTFLNVDELLSNPVGSSGQAYRFNISENLYVNFNCDIETVKFRRFTGNNLLGELKVKNQVANASKISFKTMGGDIVLAGIVDASMPDSVEVQLTSSLSEVEVDSIFYIFEDFNQNFITHKHLKGKFTAKVESSIIFDRYLRLAPNRLVADITATATNGELNNFEPMNELAPYVQNQGNLMALRFEKIKNDFHIENSTIFIPGMVVGTNVRDLELTGTHTFDQHIDYHVAVPIRNAKVDSDEAFGAVEEDDSGQSRLHLRIKGTTSKYSISYDTRAVGNQLVRNFKKEIEELKLAFKEKGKKKKAELSEEYFDWEDNQ